MQQIITLNLNDDIASIRARIEASELTHVVLLVPRGIASLETDRDWQLIRRAADDAGVQVGLVVRDNWVREQASAFGLPVFSSVSEAQKKRWHMQPVERLPVREDGERSAPSRFSPLNQRLSLPSREIWGVAVIAGVFLTMLCGLALLFVPAANVRIAPAPVGLSIATEISADPTVPQVNSSARMIPARRVTREISGTAQLKTSTEKSIPNAPSTGTVLFTNVRGEARIIPRGTIVTTSAGVPIRFGTTLTVTLPAGINARVEAPIQALDAGLTGNVKELAINTIEGSLNLEARVINLKPTASGSLKPVKVVTADDKKKLEAQLVQQLRDQGTAFLQASVKSNEVLPRESVLLEVDDSTFDKAIDDPADVLNLRTTATVYGLAIDREDVEGVVTALLQSQIQEGYNLLPGGIRMEALAGSKYQGIALRMPIRGTGYAVPAIDPGKIGRSLQGKTLQEASSYLSSSIKLVRSPEITITPMGWNRIPFLSLRVAVFVEQPSMSEK